MELRATERSSLRTCVGCRSRAEKSDLLRVVAIEDGFGTCQGPGLVPDPRGRLPGRGAYLHRDPGCLDLAERRRAFTQALRLTGPLDITAVRQWYEEQGLSGHMTGSTVTGQEKGDTT